MKELLLLVLLATTARSQEIALSVLNADPRQGGSKTGLHIESALGKYTLSFPKLMGATGEGERPSIQETSDTMTTVGYLSGATFRFRLIEDGRVSCAYEGISEDAKGFEYTLTVRRESVEGGTYQLENAAQRFPESGEKTVLAQNASGPFAFADGTGHGLKIAIPDAKHLLLDLRPAGSDEFVFRIQQKVVPPAGEFLLTIEAVRLP